MNAAIVFELPVVWLWGIACGGLLILAAWRQKRRGFTLARIAVLFGLRTLAMLALLFVVARPIRMARKFVGGHARPVMVLVDRSESMSLKESDATRYQQVLSFLNRRLLPAFK